jgi:hypothetical protein
MSEIETAEAPPTDTMVSNHLYLVDGSSYIFRRQPQQG